MTNELRAIAEAATPGPWTYDPTSDVTEIWAGEMNVADVWADLNSGSITEAQRRSNGFFIATFDPPTVLRLLADLEAAEARVGWIEQEARRFAGFYAEHTDPRNTFLIFADKIAALANPTSTPPANQDESRG